MDERRSARRDNAFIVGMVSGVMAYIADISNTGLRMIADVDLANKGQEVVIEIELPAKTIEDTRIEGKIVWKMKKNGFYFFGIEILNQTQIGQNLEKIKNINRFIASIRDNLLT